MKRAEKIFKVLDVSLTRSCNYNCSWCNQRYDLTRPMHDMRELPRRIVKNSFRTGAEWVMGLNANPYKDDYEKIVFSGGEPSLHPDFFDIVSKVTGYGSKIIVTNLSFDVDRLVDACRMNRTNAIVQPSFHYEFADFREFLEKMKTLDRHGMLSHFIPASIVDLPGKKEPGQLCARFRKEGYNASMYKFEGYYEGKFEYGDIEGFGSLGGRRRIECSSANHYVSPNGDVSFCATDTYSDEARTFGNICDMKFEEIALSRSCERYGACHISSASWIKVMSPDKTKTIWRGKNYHSRNIASSIRMYCEKKNYSWLSCVKRLYNRAVSWRRR